MVFFDFLIYKAEINMFLISRKSERSGIMISYILAVSVDIDCVFLLNIALTLLSNTILQPISVIKQIYLGECDMSRQFLWRF